MKWQW